tara:strand:- start:380 stop:2965 length:2586 start_codon:yes stop_codon:yes gene_type:complete
MSLLPASSIGDESTGFYNGVATQSLRFNDGDSDHLTFTPGSASGQTKCTISAWVKRCNLGSEHVIFHAGTASGNRGHLRFNSDDTLEWAYYNGSSWILDVNTNALYRDTTNWYHIVARLDTTDGTADIYVNNTIQTLQASVKPSSSQNTSFGENVEHQIGERGFNTTGYFDGYLADVNFINGTDLTASSFGETKEGVWIPKDTSGLTFGTNGFRLQFKQTGTGTAGDSTIGADTSGNDNHFTSNNLASGDSNLPDCPENNFCTLKGVIDHQTSGTASVGNLQLTNAGSNGWSVATCTFAVSSGKWWYEACASGSIGIGYNIGYQNVETYTGAATDGKAEGSFFYYPNTSGTAYYYVGTADSGTVDNDIDYDVGDDFVVGDVVGIALDLDSSPPTVRHYVNGVAQDAAKEIPSGNTLTPYLGLYSASVVTTFNFGQDPTFGGISVNGTSADATDSNGKGKFYDTPPTGFLALCSANLPEPTISPNANNQSSDFYNAIIYTGDGNDDRVITEGSDGKSIGFQPDITWIKNRSNGGNDLLVYDSSRGGDQAMITTSQGYYAESTATNKLEAFVSGGFRLGQSVHSSVNSDGNTYVAWNWFIGTTPTATNSESAGATPTSGSVKIDSVNKSDALAGTIPATSINANTTSGCSVVLYEGTGSAGTIAHGLSAAPKCIILKNRDSNQNWCVYHGANTSAPATEILHLNRENATDDDDTFWNDTAPTSTVFSVGTQNNTNKDGESHMAYCFVETAGFSKFGTFKGNGSTDGTFVYTGFTPAIIISKRTDTVDNWAIYDNARDTFNPRDSYIYTDSYTAAAEATFSTALVDFLSNGFKWRGAVNFGNNSSGTYVYIAFAENPFKFSNAK